MLQDSNNRVKQIKLFFGLILFLELIVIPINTNFLMYFGIYASNFFSLFIVPLTGVLKDFTSDSLYLIIQACFVGILASLICPILVFKFSNRLDILTNWIDKCLIYLLIYFLFSYGIAKFTKSQFYFPEPNTLFNTVGNLSKSMLFWTSMGSSCAYNVFMGIAECGAALLLLFFKTRFLGLLLSAFIFIQIVIINFSFGIDVKMLSLILLFISFYLFSPYFYRFKIILNPSQTYVLLPMEEMMIIKSKWRKQVKLCFLLILFLELFWNVFSTDDINKDESSSISQHTYELLEPQIINVIDSTIKVKLIHLNSKNAIVFQLENLKQKGFNLKKDAFQSLKIPSLNLELSIKKIDYSRKHEVTLNQTNTSSWSQKITLKEIDLSQLKIHQ